MNNLSILILDSKYDSYKSDVLDIFNNSEEKYDFQFLKSVNEAKKLLDNNQYLDMVILDVNHTESESKTDILHFIKHCKDHHPYIPILLFSDLNANNDSAILGFDERYRPDDFVSKSDNSADYAQSDKIIQIETNSLYDKVKSLLYRFGRIPVEEGILITHGTDTMAWAFSVLRYGLKQLKTNVVITGSQLPLLIRRPLLLWIIVRNQSSDA